MTSDIERTIVEVKGIAAPLGAYNHAVTVRPGRLMFIAGQVAVNEGGDPVGAADLPAQTRQVFHNLGQVLASAGASFENVVQFTTFIVRGQSIDDYISARREIFPRIFPKSDFPPNTLLVIDRLVREEFLIEIEAIAAPSVNSGGALRNSEASLTIAYKTGRTLLQLSGDESHQTEERGLSRLRRMRCFDPKG